SRRRHTRSKRDWSSDVCSSDLVDFLDVIKQFSCGIGGGFNDAVCTFPGDLDSDETSFDGVMFSLHDEEIIVDNEMFLYYLEKACLVFVEEIPNEKSLIDTFFEKLANDLNND